MSAPANGASAHREPHKAPNPDKNVWQLGENTIPVSSSELLAFNPRRGGGCADLP